MLNFTKYLGQAQKAWVRKYKFICALLGGNRLTVIRKKSDNVLTSYVTGSSIITEGLIMREISATPVHTDLSETN